jgi:Xaa-Pro aminopeptidase
MPSHDHAGRRRRVADLFLSLAQAQSPALLVSYLPHVRYLTGFAGSNAALLLCGTGALLATDTRYVAQAALQCPDLPVVVVPSGSGLLDALVEQSRHALGWIFDKMCVEGAHLSLDSADQLREILPRSTTFASVNGVVEAIKAVKEPAEIAAIREACRLADAACALLPEWIRPGRSERDVAWDLEAWLRTHGASKLGFDTIVASGPRSAMIHGRASERVIGSSGGPEFVLVDFGCELDGYHSDITRTFVVGGDPDERMLQMYRAVQDAQRQAVDAVGPGESGSDVDALARRILAGAGMPEMPHNTGHGLGMLVHDQARVLSPGSTVELRAGMVVTVEPGAYIDGFGGVRIEDDVLVTPDGRESLTHFPRELMRVDS